MKTTLLISALLMITSAALAQGQGQTSNAPFGAMPAESTPFQEFQPQGQLITLRVIPASKETHLYVVGKKAGSLKIEDLKVTGTVNDVNGTPHTFTFARNKDHFTTLEKLEGDVNVQVRNNDDTPLDQISFRMPERKPKLPEQSTPVKDTP